MVKKLALIQIAGTYVVSDDGQIARMLGIGNTPWHLVATNERELAIRVEQMNELIEAATDRVAAKFDAVDEVTVRSDTAATNLTHTGNGHHRIRFDLPGKGSVAGRAGIETLDLKPQHVWRLQKAGIKTVGQLVGYSEAGLVTLKGIGRGMVKAVVAALAEKGYRLKEVITG